MLREERDLVVEPRGIIDLAADGSQLAPQSIVVKQEVVAAEYVKVGIGQEPCEIVFGTLGQPRGSDQRSDRFDVV